MIAQPRSWSRAGPWREFGRQEVRAGCLLRHRTTLRMLQKEGALKLGVDPGTLAQWERASECPKVGCWFV